MEYHEILSRNKILHGDFVWVSRRFRHLFIVEKDLENSSFLRTDEGIRHARFTVFDYYFLCVIKYLNHWAQVEQEPQDR